MLTDLDRSARFETIDESLLGFKRIDNIMDLYVGCDIYWKYGNRIRLKGVITNEREGYITDFRRIVSKGMVHVRIASETPEDIQEIAEEQIEVKAKKEPPKKEPEQLSLF